VAVAEVDVIEPAVLFVNAQIIVFIVIGVIIKESLFVKKELGLKCTSHRKSVPYYRPLGQGPVVI